MQKSVEFEGKLRETNRGLLLFGVWASFLEHFGVDLKGIRRWPEKGGCGVGRDFELPFEGFPVFFSGSKKWHRD